MIIRNDIPLSAPIFEMIVAATMLIFTIRTLQKYYQRKNDITLYLLLAFAMNSIAVFITATGKCLQFGITMKSNNIIHYSDMTIIIGYIFTALFNVFIIPFIDKIYLNLGNLIVMPVTISNSIAIGLFIPYISTAEYTYNKAMHVVVFHVINTMFVMILLAYLSFRERKRNKDALARTGFLMIGLFGVFMVTMFVSFAIDLLLINLNVSLGYTPFYYLGWVFALLGVVSGYLGYIMPPWFKKLLRIS